MTARQSLASRYMVFAVAGLALVTLATVMTPLVMAQSLVSGDIAGTVTDPSGDLRDRRLPICVVAAWQLHPHCDGSRISANSRDNYCVRRASVHRKREVDCRQHVANGGSDFGGSGLADREREHIH
jgi:hypothetical protein